MPSKHKIPVNHAEFVALCRVAIQDQMRRLKWSKFRIRVPRQLDVMRLQPGLHLHALPEITIQLSGKSSMRFLNETLISEPRDLLLIPRGMAHKESALHPQDLFLNLVIKFSREEIHFHFATYQEKVEPSIATAEIFKVSSLKLAEHFQDASEALLGKGSESEDVGHGLLLAGFAGLLEVLDLKHEEKEWKDSRLRQCQMLIDIHFADPNLSVASLAKQLGYSSSHLSRLFHVEHGDTLSRYITDTRLKNARHLLRESTLSIKEIAWASGYVDGGYFIRVFKRTLGTTPMEYRKGVAHRYANSNTASSSRHSSGK